MIFNKNQVFLIFFGRVSALTYFTAEGQHREKNILLNVKTECLLLLK